jgi:FKBP-type peptidyl-prolyl cis-trans isomerase FklB
MNAKIIAVIFLSVAVSFQSFGQKKKKDKKSKEIVLAVVDTVKLKTASDSVSYSLGVMFGANLGKAGFEKLNSALVAQGMDESMEKKTTLITAEKANEILNNYVVAQHQKKAEKNLAEGNAFLEKNKLNADVVTLPSGLQYKILVEGKGEKPTANSKVTVHYHGMLINGTVFDSSVERGEPIELTVNGVIEGWKEALQLMPVGSKWKLFIPSKLAYGENPMQGPIEPNSALIFEVELISISKEQ